VKLLFSILSLFLFSLYAQAYNLILMIPNIKNAKGGVHVAIFSSKNKKSFTKTGEEFRVVDFKAEGSSGKYIIKDLPDGEYALAIYHDENGDKKCNTNFVGIPKEGYGFSNNVKPKMSAPKFDECRVDLRKDASIEIRLNY